MPSRQQDPLNGQLQWVFLQNSFVTLIIESVEIRITYVG